MLDSVDYKDIDIECWLENQKQVERENKIFQLVREVCPYIQEPTLEQQEWLYYGN